MSAAADPEITGWHLQGSIHWHVSGEYEQDGQRRSWREIVTNGVEGVADAMLGGDAAVAAAAAPGRGGLRNSSYLQANCFKIPCPRFLFDSGSYKHFVGLRHQACDNRPWRDK